MVLVKFFSNVGRFNSFFQEIQKFSFCRTYAPIGTEFENIAETNHKPILELNIFQLVKQVFHSISMQRVVKGREGQKAKKNFGVWLAKQE